MSTIRRKMMQSAWLSYVPRYVAQDISAHPHASPIGREQRLDAVALFADISGFTAMSEALGRSGRAGTEELTDILNAYFDPMIALIHSFGGVIGKFGGDAMTVLFPCTGRSRAATVRRALQCALDMQAAMPRYEGIATSAGSFSLAMKAGLAMGPLVCTSVGDPAIRLEYIIAGSVLDLCADAEHHAAKGEVIAHNALLPHAGAVEIAEERAGYSLLVGLKRRAVGKPLGEVRAVSEAGLETVGRYLHPAVAQLLAAGQSGFINEHRKVTVLFVRFDGFDYDGDVQVSARLQHYFEEVVRIVDRYDGYLNKVDMGDKGSKYIVLFGAPVQHEDDEERALRCALELNSLQDVPSRIGVNTGFVFCGQVGAQARQEYTVMGDPVNVAARLMQAARAGQVLVSEYTRQRVAQTFGWEESTSLRVKGKAEPLQVYTVGRTLELAGAGLEEVHYLLPMVGREAELEVARGVIERALGGQGQLVGITAEAGIGKSRLGAEVVRLASERGFVGYGGAGQSYGMTSSYLIWQGLWRAFFGISPAWPLERQHEHLARELSSVDPNLVVRMPLLQVLLNIPIPDNDLTQSLDPQLRAELLRSLLLQCLRERARLTPILFMLEDAHWMDPVSLELLEFLGRNLQDLPVLLVVLYRTLEGDIHELERLRSFPHATEIRLTEFTPDEAQRLIVAKLEQQWGALDQLPEALVQRVTTKAQGNPFYIEEMINYLRDRGIDPQDTAAVEQLELPDSLHNLVMSRIDTLGNDERTTLKVASVIGRLFKAEWLWGSYPEVGAPPTVKHHLERISRLELTVLDKPEPELDYLFKHITTQEVAYESLAFALRATLHEQVGEFVERLYADRLAQQVDVLAHHYGRSRNTGKQRVYFRRAADAAKAAYANQAAVNYYQRLLPLLPETEQSDVMRELGEVWQLVGKWPEADAIYRKALATAEQAGDRRAEARAEAALGDLLSSTQSYSDALPWLMRARSTLEQLGDWQALSRVLGNLSNAHSLQSEYEQALVFSDEQIRLAVEQNDPESIGRANYQLAIVYAHQGNFDQALIRFQNALNAAVAAGDRRTAVLAGGDMAYVYMQQGGYGRALVSLFEVLQVAAEIGSPQMIGFLIQNAGEIYRLHGDFPRALACYARALQVSIELGDMHTILTSLGNTAIIFDEQGRYDEAEPLFVRAIELGRELNTAFVHCEFAYHAAALLTRQQRFADAEPVNREAHDLAIQVENSEFQFKTELLAIHLRLARRTLDKAAAVVELRALLDHWSDDQARAALHYAIWQLNPMHEEARTRAADLYRQLYDLAPNVEYLLRYKTLTGNVLPPSPPLPALPEQLLGTPVGLEVLLARAGVSH